MENGDAAAGAWFLILLSIALYLLPTLVAAARGRAVGPVAILNIFLGWTLIGWVGALIWAATERTAKEDAARGL
jgi:Superinfection immunity protein